MEISPFKDAVGEISAKLGGRNPWGRYSLDSVYENPQNYLREYAYVIYIARNLPHKMGEELNATVEEIAAHCEEKLGALDDGEEKISQFHEKIRQTPIMWAGYALSRTVIADLKYPVAPHFNAERLPDGIASHPPYALDIIAQSETALKQFSAEEEGTRKKNKENIEKVARYAKSYYVERAPIDLAARFVFHIDRMREEADRWPEDTAEAIEKVRSEVLEGGGDNERGAQISAVLAHYEKAFDAAKLIAGQRLEGIEEIAAIWAGLSEERDDNREYLADPSRYLFAQHVDEKSIAGLKLVHQHLADAGELDSNPELKEAFGTVEAFIDEVLRARADSFGRTFDETIAEHQKDIRYIRAASAVEKGNPALEGLRALVITSTKEKHLASSIKPQDVLDYAVALGEAADAGAEHAGTVQEWINAYVARSGAYNLGYTIIHAEERLAQDDLGAGGRDALEGMIEHAHAYYGAPEAAQELQRTLRFCRAMRSGKSLQEKTGLSGLSKLLVDFDTARRGGPYDEERFEARYLHSQEGLENIPHAVQCVAILQHMVNGRGEDAAAAQNVVDYFRYYFSAAGMETALERRVDVFLPAWEAAQEQEAGEKFLRAIDGDESAAAFFVGQNNAAGRYIHRQMNMASPETLARISHAMVDDAPMPPVMVAGLLADHPSLGRIANLVPRMADNPQAALWDTAKWLCDAESSLKYGMDKGAIKPRVENITEYIRTVYPSGGENDVIALTEEMREALEAMSRFDMNNHLLKRLCADTPDIPESREAQSQDASPANLALLREKLEEARTGQDERRKTAAEAVIPFLEKAMEHAGASEAVAAGRAEINKVMEAAAAIDSIENPIVADRGELLRHMGYGGYGLANMRAVVEDGLAAAEEGVTALSEQQMQALSHFKSLIDGLVESRGEEERFNEHLPEAKAEVAFGRIMAAKDALPELESIRDADGNAASITSFHDLRYQSFTEERIPHLTEQFYIAVQDALEREDALPPGLQRSLRAVEAHLSAEFEKVDAYARGNGSRGNHITRIQEMREQRGSDGRGLR